MDIKNILSNFTIQDILIIILILIIIYQIFKPPRNEKFADLDTATLTAINTAVQSQINNIYDLDVEAMRNLGAISKTILTGANYDGSGATKNPGTLTIPANLVVLGSITYNGTAANPSQQGATTTKLGSST